MNIIEKIGAFEDLRELAVFVDKFHRDVKIEAIRRAPIAWGEVGNIEIGDEKVVDIYRAIDEKWRELEGLSSTANR